MDTLLPTNTTNCPSTLPLGSSVTVSNGYQIIETSALGEYFLMIPKPLLSIENETLIVSGKINSNWGYARHGQIIPNSIHAELIMQCGGIVAAILIGRMNWEEIPVPLRIHHAEFGDQLIMKDTARVEINLINQTTQYVSLLGKSFINANPVATMRWSVGLSGQTEPLDIGDKNSD